MLGTLAADLWLLLAVQGLSFAVAGAGLPVAGQGAFVAMGAFATADLAGPGHLPLLLAALLAVAAAVLGRLGSARGALVGGLVLGVAEELVTNLSTLGPGYGDALPLGILVAVRAVRPGGLRAGPEPVLD